MKKTILITGASTGIGRGTAKYFAEQGWNVAATMRKPEKATELQELDNLKLFRLDVQDKESIQKAVQDSLDTFGQIDVVLNNAGYGAWGPLESASDEQIRRQFDVNVFGLLDVTRAVLPHMRSRKQGTIINVTSVGGRITTPLGSLYHGTKWAVEGITEALKYELEPLGIRVKVVEPGGVKTDFAGRSLDVFDNKEADYEPIIKSVMALMERDDIAPSTPTDIAKVIFKAANDGGKRLRYPAGNDAKMFLRIRSLFGASATQSLLKRYFKL